ncbi:MAG: hypothetical protein AAF514_00250 [Verrucomicrobiota bacterium]
MDVNRPTKPVILCFVGGLGWNSEPEVGGFVLSVGGRESIRFDVTRTKKSWVSEDGENRLTYVPTWSSEVDSGGFFFLELSHFRLTADRRISLSVRSVGQGSRRWFALDSEQKIEERLVKLREALAALRPVRRD